MNSLHYYTKAYTVLVQEEVEECLDECITRKELKCETNNKEVSDLYFQK